MKGHHCIFREQNRQEKRRRKEEQEEEEEAQLFRSTYDHTHPPVKSEPIAARSPPASGYGSAADSNDRAPPVPLPLPLPLVERRYTRADIFMLKACKQEQVVMQEFGVDFATCDAFHRRGMRDLWYIQGQAAKGEESHEAIAKKARVPLELVRILAASPDIGALVPAK